MDYSDYVRKIRDVHRLTQAQLAQKIGFAQSTVSDIENKRKTASNRFKTALALVYPPTPELKRLLYEIQKETTLNGS